MKIYIPIILSILSIFSACDSEAGWQNLEVIETVKIDPVIDWTAVADSCTFVLVEQFMNKEKGTFWKSPKNVSGGSYNIYWQQAHAMDVIVYAYERIKNKNPELADTYENYFRLWLKNKANNYNHDKNDETGFLNSFTDDMCWICLTLIHMSEATGDDVYINMAKTVYDTHIITRARTDAKGTGLPWKSNDESRNACTNSPGCLIAAKLYKKYGTENYLNDAKMLYDYIVKNLLKGDGRVEEPPLTYTQGTFGEACRQLYHITQERQYMRKAEEVINYTMTSDRCLQNWILRDEGTSMDGSIFKAVFIPYAVNLALDEKASDYVKKRIILFLQDNATVLWNNLDRSLYPEMYCNYYWGKVFPSGDIASMGAQTSGASLMEGVARMLANLAE
ncbi:glycoside hydrolase family 76 protein [Bacteroides sp. L008]|uniref:glycoside hydrolase family 76 protein n=1 Tax=Bacteroides sp. L008 TaxID=3162404 RepID=UPI003465E906